MSNPSRILRIAVFFDGGYFDEVSKFYKFQHGRGARLSIPGILQFCRHSIAEREKIDISCTQIVESHYFRGRFAADEVEAQGKLRDQAAFDQVLIRAGVIQHYAPMAQNVMSRKEQGIDVWLALEAFDVARSDRADIVVLVASDGDFVPLVRKVAGVGVRTVLLGWEFRYQFEPVPGRVQTKETKVSVDLMGVSTYPIMMNSIIDDRSRVSDPIIKGLFVPAAEVRQVA